MTMARSCAGCEGGPPACSCDTCSRAGCEGTPPAGVQENSLQRWLHLAPSLPLYVLGPLSLFCDACQSVRCCS